MFGVEKSFLERMSGHTYFLKESQQGSTIDKHKFHLSTVHCLLNGSRPTKYLWTALSHKAAAL